MVKKNKKLDKEKGKEKEKESLSLIISIPLFLCTWYVFISLIFNFSIGLIHLIKYPTAFGLFFMPIAFAICFISGLLTLVFANQIKFRLRELKN